uniref:Adenine DNA glycosylase n=1 Tax=Mycena chlorophos TaxID=658473 RepID=A0ABQ0KX20_MYCCL|nr:predicted protein [Mycena chlorophos]
MAKRKYDTDHDEDEDEDYVSPRRLTKKKTTTSESPHGHAKSTHVINKANIDPIRSSLLRWYATVHDSRNMPWRKAYNPSLGPAERAQRAYEVWISEIMLQQTTVATVIPYYQRWMQKFPTIHELAHASIDNVNALWKGLGYYSRASRLLAGAKKAVEEFDGKLPGNAKDLQAHIPGIGRYSAGAISSIAYSEDAPVLDGNVTRLLSRLLALHAPPKGKATLDILWNAATAMVDGLSAIKPQVQYAGDINQALIELGSTVCKPKDPNCDVCPLQSWCTARTRATRAQSSVEPDIEDLCTLCLPLSEGADVTSYPMRVEKKKAREELDIVCVTEWRKGTDRRFLLVRRPEKGLLAGLDEFPALENVSQSLSAAKQGKVAFKVLPNVLRDVKIKSVETIGDILHVFSHIKKTYRVQWVRLESTPEPPQPVAVDGVPPSWIALDDVGSKNIGTGIAKSLGRCICADGRPHLGTACHCVYPLDRHPRVFAHIEALNMSEDRYALYAVLNLSEFATDQEIHERHRALSLAFHPDKHRSSEENERVATEKFLEVQRAYEVLCDPFLRKVYDSLGPAGLRVNWMENARTRSAAELETVFSELRREWVRNKVDMSVAPRGRATYSVDAISLFEPYMGQDDDPWTTRAMNRLSDVRMLHFTLRHDTQLRINERTTISLAARLARQANGGRGNFIGTLRHQWSPRLSFKATSTFLFPYELGLRGRYEAEQSSASVETVVHPLRSLFPPSVQMSLSRRFSRRADAMQGNLKVYIGHEPQVSISLTSQDPLRGHLNRPSDQYLALLPFGRILQATSFGLVLDSYPKVFAERGLTFTHLSTQLKLSLEYGVDGLAWALTTIWGSQFASLSASLRLSAFGVSLILDGSYMNQGLSIPIILSNHYDATLALWATAVPSAACLALYQHRARKLQRQRRWEISAALRALEPDSPIRRDAEAILAFLKDKARDCRTAEASKGGLVVVEATYGALDPAERDLGLVWDVTIALQVDLFYPNDQRLISVTALVRASQVYISGRQPKSSIQGILDPAPFTLKSLRVHYLFRGRPHYIEIPEYLPLVLPLKAHLVDSG